MGFSFGYKNDRCQIIVPIILIIFYENTKKNRKGIAFEMKKH